ncbi:carbohydrate ABC transporter permease [Mollicutes bacterium LVI A0078]|nr:carbohydrate ABC transporter permease [Mollicutes bacterium LVI A0075]WOO91451.1 carbohydrate ABC transporter permease [Mollicutes bacterium LVI A0078]
MYKSKKSKIITILFLLLGAIIMVFPLYWMITTSFKTLAEANQVPPTFTIHDFSLEAYGRLFDKMPFLLYLKNTLIIVLFSFGGLLLSALAGYGFSKYEFKHKEVYFVVVLATMMIPYQVTMIPNFLLINKLGLVNTFAGIALPGLVSGFTIFLFRQFMNSIPDEIIEAARVEGLSEFQIFFKIVLPMSKPILAIQSILVFIGSWNSFLWPLIVAQSQDKYTLSIGLSLLQGQNTSDVPLQMAGATLMIIPILIVFFTLQKYILDGYNLSGIK